MVSGLYTAIGSYYALKSFIGAFLKLIILALVVLAGVVIVLWIFPWTWALAYVGTAAYVAIAIPTIIIAVWMNYILESGINEPPDCCCFDGNTELELMNSKNMTQCYFSSWLMESLKCRELEKMLGDGKEKWDNEMKR